MNSEKQMLDEFRQHIKLTRQRIAMLTGTLGIDSDEITVRAFVELLENIQYRPDALKMFLKERTIL